MIEAFARALWRAAYSARSELLWQIGSSRFAPEVGLFPSIDIWRRFADALRARGAY